MRLFALQGQTLFAPRFRSAQPWVHAHNPAPPRGVGDAAPYNTIRRASHYRKRPRRPGGRPPYIPLYYIPQPQPPVISRCRLTTYTKQKAGANISFAPAVLLLRSHSLITLFVIFRTASASSWESSYLYANFVCPFKTLTNCSLDLPSGSLFA